MRQHFGTGWAASCSPVACIVAACAAALDGRRGLAQSFAAPHWCGAGFTDEDCMRDQRLVSLMVLILILNVGHTIDHLARGAVRGPLTADSVAFIVVSAIIYALIGFGLYFYRHGKIG